MPDERQHPFIRTAAARVPRTRLSWRMAARFRTHGWAWRLGTARPTQLPHTRARARRAPTRGTRALSRHRYDHLVRNRRHGGRCGSRLRSVPANRPRDQGERTQRLRPEPVKPKHFGRNLDATRAANHGNHPVAGVAAEPDAQSRWRGASPFTRSIHLAHLQKA